MWPYPLAPPPYVLTRGEPAASCDGSTPALGSGRGKASCDSDQSPGATGVPGPGQGDTGCRGQPGPGLVAVLGGF